ncbi:hypothetical protein MNBD_GAMMA11-3410 [hydrothermal vent metagenome]|uniref:Lipoprotein n=1 Tax=hydrothermal vent metagenome TaxID=652676 RepID=A0A3B0XW42_9ZZZZ
MDKIILNYLFLFFKILSIFSLLATTSCSSIEMVSIKNNTYDVIQFRGQFITKYGDINNLDFILKPDNSNLWRYESGYMEEKHLDKGLKKIFLKNTKGCEITLDRSEIENIAKKNGMWEININEKTMDCEKQSDETPNVMKLKNNRFSLIFPV